MGPRTQQAMILARAIARIQGYETPSPSFRFDKARHPRTRAIWETTRLAYEHLLGTHIQDVIDEEDERQPRTGEGEGG
jgi:hypothetical protein